MESPPTRVIAMFSGFNTEKTGSEKVTFSEMVSPDTVEVFAYWFDVIVGMGGMVSKERTGTACMLRKT